MSISPQLTRALQHALGQDASEEFVARFEETVSLRADLAEVRHEMRVGFERARADMSEIKAELMKWSFVYWIGAVTAIAVLFRTLR